MVNETKQVSTNKLSSVKVQIILRIMFWFIGGLSLFFSLLNLMDKVREQPFNEERIAFWSVISLSVGYLFAPLLKRMVRSYLFITLGCVGILLALLILGVVFLWVDQTSEAVRSFVLSFDPYIWLWIAGGNFERAVNSETFA